MSDDDETSPDKENNCVCSKENLKKFLEKEFAKMTDHFDKKLEKMTEHFDQKFEKMTDNYIYQFRDNFLKMEMRNYKKLKD